MVTKLYSDSAIDITTISLQCRNQSCEQKAKQLDILSSLIDWTVKSNPVDSIASHEV